MRGLYVLFDGLTPTVIDSQVMAHVRAVRTQLGITFDVLVGAGNGALYRYSLSHLEAAQSLSGGSVFLHQTARPAFPFSAHLNRRLIHNHLVKMGPYDFIHARSDYTAAIIGPVARAADIPVLWDCRGDVGAEFQLRATALPNFLKPLKRWRMRQHRNNTQQAAITCQAACFVSAELRNAVLPSHLNPPSWIIPCAAPEEQFFFDPKLRNVQRRQLGYKDEDIVFVYSGSLVSYQLFDEMVALMTAAQKTEPRIKLLVLTTELAAATARLVDFSPQALTMHRAVFGDVNAYLNAADIGLLLRDPSAVNHGAFPTKFAEYCMAGLQVMMKADPPACLRMAKKFGNLLQALDPLSLESLQPILSDPMHRAKIAVQAAHHLGRNASMGLYAEIYHNLVKPIPLNPSR